VFWGRLDFGPNVDALEWFLAKVWPAVRAAEPAATFAVFGFSPTARVRELAKVPGVELHPDLPDLRAEVRRRQAVVLPFVSGGGIKNKLLEGAAMGRPIVCTPRAAMDLRSAGSLPLERVTRPAEWVDRIVAMWGDAARRQELGRAAREWVSEYYSWAAPARNALAAMKRGRTC